MPNMYEDLNEQISNVFAVFQDAFKRDDIQIGTWARDLMNGLRGRQLSNFYHLIAEAIKENQNASAMFK